ncbi:MAG TPA: ATP-binding cassette domain-containing protein, partial [Sedimentibacter sp.]|nr:ATP-binding cassette domain-containing protein [Sedimentibacter sp.]
MNINFSGLTKEYAGKTIFENLKGQINDGDKIGLIGANGAGKTTLARILAGEEVKDAGEIDYSPSYLKILYIQQYPEFDKGITVYEDILGFISRWNEDKNRKNPSEIATVAKTVLNKVGLEEKFWHRTALSLSGGEKTKLALSRMFAVDFDLLVLDEPTNHLDIGSCEWLEDFIKNLDKPMLIISHDRFFLDRTVNRIWDLSSRGLKVYEGNYT